jgi:hypothetical protein
VNNPDWTPALIAKKYSSEGFRGCNDPLESVLFSIAVEMQKEREYPLLK